MKATHATSRHLTPDYLLLICGMIMLHGITNRNGCITCDAWSQHTDWRTRQKNWIGDKHTRDWPPKHLRRQIEQQRRSAEKREEGKRGRRALTEAGKRGRRRGRGWRRSRSGKTASLGKTVSSSSSADDGGGSSIDAGGGSSIDNGDGSGQNGGDRAWRLGFERGRDRSGERRKGPKRFYPKCWICVAHPSEVRYG
jgi:hypothetical protein